MGLGVLGSWVRRGLGNGCSEVADVEWSGGDGDCEAVSVVNLVGQC